MTGVHNRKKLDAYFREKVVANNRKSFSAILIDINNFKAINDNFGHSVGDEFCIILDIANQKDLEAMVERIKQCVKNYNATSSQHCRNNDGAMRYQFEWRIR